MQEVGGSIPPSSTNFLPVTTQGSSLFSSLIFSLLLFVHEDPLCLRLCSVFVRR
jgi:hypothetical protein